MTQRLVMAVGLLLALAGLGSIALAAGWEAPATPVRQESAAPGHWTLSGTGVLAWTTDGAAGAPSASWYVERSKELSGIQADIECQIAACASR